METVLLIDRESVLLNSLQERFEGAGYGVLKASTGAQGLELIRAHFPDLVVMDVVLPDMKGSEVIDHIKCEYHWRMIPVLVISARGAVSDRIDGLTHGADDYLAKPFDETELILRVQSLLRRSSADRCVRCGPFVLDRAHFRCFLGGKALELTNIEFRILAFLIDHVGQTMERVRLIDYVWQEPEGDRSRSLDTHMKRLRCKLGPHADAIQTIRAKGYLFSQSSV